MPRTSIAVSVLVAASLIGAGAGVFATTSDESASNGDGPAANDIMAQLEKSGTGSVGAGATAAESVADAKGTLHVPEDYRGRCRFIGSWAVASGDKGSTEMHSVYASPGRRRRPAASRMELFW